MILNNYETDLHTMNKLVAPEPFSKYDISFEDLFEVMAIVASGVMPCDCPAHIAKAVGIARSAVLIIKKRPHGLLPGSKDYIDAMLAAQSGFIQDLSESM
jgi:hypothetical protein